jgi:CRISPR/Cas system-associated exonuclease Cas4 (RecB family)
MPLPDNFQFSQNNLQDYRDCARRFQLRYILHQEWPAVQSEPVLKTEQLIELGQNFHRLVLQIHSGIPEETITASIKDVELETLWLNYLRNGPARHEQQTKAEFTLSIPFAGFRLIARYDLLMFKPDSKFLIYDWKTSQKQPKQEFMLQRMQSKVYPFVIATTGYPLAEPVLPENIEMIYWYPYHPETPTTFSYSAQQQKKDRSELEEMAKEIQVIREPIFPLTMDLSKCKYCTYRSLCERGEKAGNLDEFEDMDSIQPDQGWDLDFENLEEIAF